MHLTLSSSSSGTFLPFTLAALRISFMATSFLPWVMSQRADSGRILIETQIKTLYSFFILRPELRCNISNRSFCWPVEASNDKNKRAEEHQLQDPPVADDIGEARQHHQSEREEGVADNGAEGKLGGVTPLSTFTAMTQREISLFLPLLYLYLLILVPVCRIQ